MLLRWITVTGWTTWGIALAALAAGLLFSWREVVLVGCALAVAGVLGLIWLGRRVRVSLDFAPLIVRAEPGGAATVTLRARAPQRSGVSACDLDIPAGQDVWTRRLGRLRAGGSAEIDLTVDTPRRMIIPLGPIRVVRRDPLGFYERRLEVPALATVVVHPRVASLPPLSAGFVRDLEGETSRDLTDSDLSFHALREYVAGDDRRQIHWRSSAKTGRLMVRQYEQTRRSRMMIVFDTATENYGDEAEFELAVSVAASLGVRALRDSREVAFVVAPTARPHDARRFSGSRLQSIEGVATLSSVSPTRLLDDASGLQLVGQGPDLGELTRRSVVEAMDVSIVFLVTGSVPSLGNLQHASVPYGAGVEVVALRCALEATPALRSAGRLSLGTIGRLDDLTRLIARDRVSR